MKTLANRAKLALERLGYEYGSSRQFSVELTSNAIVVNEKIDLSSLTNQKDEIRLIFFLRESRHGGMLEVNAMSATLSRQPQNEKRQILSDEKFSVHQGLIPTKQELIKQLTQDITITDSMRKGVENKHPLMIPDNGSMYLRTKRNR